MAQARETCCVGLRERARRTSTARRAGAGPRPFRDGTRRFTLVQRERSLEIGACSCEIALALPDLTAHLQRARDADAFARRLPNAHCTLREGERLVERLRVTREFVRQDVNQPASRLSASCRTLSRRVPFADRDRLPECRDGTLVIGALVQNLSETLQTQSRDGPAAQPTDSAASTRLRARSRVGASASATVPQPCRRAAARVPGRPLAQAPVPPPARPSLRRPHSARRR